MSASAPEPARPLDALLVAGRHGDADGDAVRFTSPSLAIVQLTARRGRAGDVAASVRSAFGFDLPGAGVAAGFGDVEALSIQPDGWLILAPRGVEGALARAVTAAGLDAGSVVDQTHGKTLLRITGKRAAWVLAKECRVDLHPRAFGPGRVAGTAFAHLSCVVHQRDAAPIFDLIFAVTTAGSFVHALTHAAEETGYEVV